MIEAMFDNETWGVRATSVVRSVGIVVFDGTTVLEKHYFRIDEERQLDARVLMVPDGSNQGMILSRRTKDQSTVEWWAKPENAAAQATIAEAPLISWEDARTICGKVGDKAKHVWAKPGMFDLPMLRDLFGQDIWAYWKERDMQTLLGEFDPLRKTRPPFVGTPHNALDDAIHAHDWLVNLRRMIPYIVARSQETPGDKIWSCKIGECTDDELSQFFAAADEPMREAVREAYIRVTGKRPDFVFSGWGAMLDRDEREVVAVKGAG